MERITVTINNWQKWNPRKDYRKPTWFAMSNDLLDHPDFADFTPLEFHALIYIFSQASKRNSATIDVIPLHARQRGITDKTLSTTIEKLERNQTLAVFRTESVQNPNESVQNPYSTERQTGNTDRQRERESKSAGADRLPRLAEIWNEHSGPLGKVRSTNAQRNHKAAIRFKETTEGEWVDTVKLIAQSDFCVGKNDRGWKATFDWLLQPETRLKVLEGKYQNRNQAGAIESDWKAKTLRDLEARKKAREIEDGVA